jgi:hypothetical protein
MDSSPNLPPIQAVARLVALYQSKNPRQTSWAGAQPDPDTMAGLIRDHHWRLQQALAVAHQSRLWMRVPLAPAGAVAYLVLENGTDLGMVIRFLAPDPDEVQHGTGDPRASLYRTMLTHSREDTRMDDRTVMAYLITGWRLYAQGLRAEVVSWTPDEDMPAVHRYREQGPWS